MSWKEFWETAAMACVGTVLAALAIAASVLLATGMLKLVLG